MSYTIVLAKKNHWFYCIIFCIKFLTLRKIVFFWFSIDRSTGERVLCVWFSQFVNMLVLICYQSSEIPCNRLFDSFFSLFKYLFGRQCTHWLFSKIIVIAILSGPRGQRRKKRKHGLKFLWFHARIIYGFILCILDFLVRCLSENEEIICALFMISKKSYMILVWVARIIYLFLTNV